MGYISVEIDADDIDDDDLFNEIGKRIEKSRNKGRKLELIELCKEHLEVNPVSKYGVKVSTMDDELKMNLLMDAFCKYSLSELEAKLNF